MKNGLSKYFDKLFYKNWTIGICKGDIKDIIRNRSFDPDITWLFAKSYDKYYADPFIIKSVDGTVKILHEEFPYATDYGILSVVTLDKDFKPVSYKTLLDTKSHISYPFYFTENNKTYIFPEAGQSGKLSCYEYDTVKETMSFVKDLIDLPIRDSTILKKDNKYWLFGTVGETETGYKLYVFYADSLLGPYTAHRNNPVKDGLNGNRPAGNFIEVDGALYRPTQNCKNIYGESITIFKVTELNEKNVNEQPYFDIFINKKNKHNPGIRTIHTINAMDNIIVVDGIKWTFSPIKVFKGHFRYKQVRAKNREILKSGR
jgi:hypothetical protein